MQPYSNSHTFLKGIKDSVDISKLSNDTWSFPTLNVRLLNKSGQGYIVTPLKGNTVNDGSGGVGGKDLTGAVMRIASGYVILAVKEFNGILYIISHNNSSGVGEIGVYPAPIPLLNVPILFSAASTYVIGDRVSYGGVVYICIIANGPAAWNAANWSATFTPALTGFPTGTTTYPFGRFYAPLGNFNPVTGSMPAAYDPAGAGYVVGNTVTYDNHVYKCVVATGAVPGAFDPSEWTIWSLFNTSAFGFWFDNQTEIEIRPHYDNSVNLYITDYKNPNRAINSGFDMTTGALTSTVYDVSSFYTNLNQFMGTSKSLTITDVDIIPTGAHKYGNYFFYLRYVNASLDKTDVVTSSNACQIYQGSMSNESTIEGGNGVSAVFPYSGKKVVLHIDTATLDTSYSFIDVVFTRYYGDPTSGVQLRETWEIADYTQYAVSDVLSTGLITIIGDEDVIAIDEGELLTVRGIENTCKTQTQLGNIWWGGNWKGIDIDNDTLVDFAKLIKITFDDTHAISGTPVDRTAAADIPPDAAHGQYDDYKQTYDYVGYFRGEPYVFGAVFELNTGQETEAYPLNGVDNYYNGSLIGTPAEYDPATTTLDGNYDGKYRFPTGANSPAFIAGSDLRILGVKFDTSAAVTFLGTVAADWIKANVRGMYFVRMDRKETLKYQGLMMPGSKSYLCYDDNNVPLDTPIEYTTGIRLSATPWNISVINQDNTGTKDYEPLTPGQGGDIWTAAELTASYGNKDETWLDISYTVICDPNVDHSFGQFVGKVAGDSLGVPDWITDHWCSRWLGWNGGVPDNHESNDGGTNDHSYYKDIYFPVYRGYMPEIYYLNNSDKFRYYQNRWYHYWGKQCFYSPDYILDKSPSIQSDYWIKHIARTQAFDFDNWHSKSQDSYGVTNFDLRPYYVLSEVNDGYKYDKLLSIEQCNVFEIGNISDVDALSVGADKYVNTGKDYADYTTVMGDRSLWAAVKNATRQHWSTRSIRAASYIGIDTVNDINEADTNESNYRLAISNMYITNVEDPTFSILTWYGSTYASPFYKISDYIALFDSVGAVSLGASYTCYKGDCFLQRFYFKQMAFNCSQAFTGIGQDGIDAGDVIACNYSGVVGPVFDDPGPTAVDSDKMRYADGVIIGIIVEMKFNGNMRYKETGYDPTYYPRVDAYPWNMQPWNADGVESLYYNTGHHRVLDNQAYFMFNPALPLAQNKHLTRIRFSDIHDQYSIVDGYRNIMPLAYKDYDSGKQQIMKIGVLRNQLVSVQEDCINRHFTVEKDATVDMTSGVIAMGSGDTLSEIVNRVANFGTQHQYSVVFTDSAIYGVDAFRRILWLAKMTTTTTGSYVMGGIELNRTKYVEEWLYNWLDQAQPITDIIGRIPDKPIVGYGIVAGYDSRYKDVIFSFFNHSNSTLGYTIAGITAFNKKWDISFDYHLDYFIVYNSFDMQWYYSKKPAIATSNVGFRPDLYPNYWKLLDFSIMTNFTVTPHVAGDIIRCCGVDPDRMFDCYAGNIYVVTTSENPQDCTSLAKTSGGHVNYNVLSIKCCEDLSKTLIFNEDLDEFIGETSYNSVVYSNIYNDLFSGGNTSLMQDSYLWKHDLTDYLWFYGSDESMILSYYENGNSEKATLSGYEKDYESLDIHGSSEEYYKVYFETENQEGGHFPYINDTDFWKTPEYLEHHWKVPVMVKEDADSGDFNTESSMQGTFLKTTFTYRGKISMFIKSISTWFRTSNS